MLVSVNLRMKEVCIGHLLLMVFGFWLHRIDHAGYNGFGKDRGRHEFC